MSDLSLVFRMLLHYRPAAADGRIDAYMGIGFEGSLFNPYSDQQEVRQAFGHEFVRITFDIARCGRGKLSAFAEWEI